MGADPINYHFRIRFVSLYRCSAVTNVPLLLYTRCSSVPCVPLYPLCPRPSVPNVPVYPLFLYTP